MDNKAGVYNIQDQEQHKTDNTTQYIFTFRLQADCTEQANRYIAPTYDTIDIIAGHPSTNSRSGCCKKISSAPNYYNPVYGR
jgi:hypothetical protein